MAKQIKTACGLIEGVKCGNYTVYRGVPFAKPPVGERRWKAPERPDAWDGVFKADTFSAKCMQSVPGPGNPYLKEFYTDPEFLRPSDEDCLYLNIWTPAGASADDKLLSPSGSMEAVSAAGTVPRSNSTEKPFWAGHHPGHHQLPLRRGGLFSPSLAGCGK